MSLVADHPPSDPPGPPDAAPSGPMPTRRRGVLATVRRPRVWIPTLVVLVAAAAALWWFVLRSDGEAVAAASTTEQVVEVTTGSVDVTVSAEGTVTAAETADLSFASAGTVAAVNVAAGDTVTAGQVLATIDSAELEADVAAAEADVADAEAKLADDEDAGASDEQIEADESSLGAAQDVLDNAVAALAGAQLIAEFDGTVTTVELTVGEQLGSGGTGGTSSTGSSSGSGQSSSSMGSSGGQAPGGSSGTTEGSGSSTSAAQIQIVSTGRYEVELSVDSADVDGLEVGQEAAVTVSTSSSSSSGFPGGGFPGGGAAMFPGGAAGGPPGMTGDTETDADTGEDSDIGAGDAGTGEMPAMADEAAASANGTVTEVGRVADASSGVASYPVTISFSDDSGDIYVGSTVTAEITTSTRDDVVQVMSMAVSTEDGASTVQVALDGTVEGARETRTVQVGETVGRSVEIVSGLEPGEQVIVELPSFAGPGSDVASGGGMPGGFAGGGGGMPTAGGAPTGAAPTDGGATSEEEGE